MTSSSTQAKLLEAKLAMHLAMHGTMASSSCLIKVLKDTITSSEQVESATLGRTKCTAIVKNVLAPMCKDLLKKDIGDGPFSLFVDEATDKAGHISYFGKRIKKYNFSVDTNFVKILKYYIYFLQTS